LGWLLFWRRDRKKLAGIRFRVLRNGRSNRRFLMIHGNEQTAREVLTAHMKQAAGIAYLVENMERNVEFRSGELDPNRMYSREGAERNLRRLNPQWSEGEIQSALTYLDRRRDDVLKAVRPKDGDVLIAVHNNSQGYSVRDEVPISNRIAMNDADNPNEFCLCTDERDFELLSKGTYNVVLQNRTDAADDGSLSRFAARSGFRYVNIEAALGKFDRQRAMLQWVDATLPHA
jgi:hypothetical protein